MRVLLGVSLAALLVTLSIDYALYRRNLAATSAQLRLVVSAQVRLIDSMRRFHDAHGDHHHVPNSFAEILMQLRAAHEGYPLLGRTGQVLFGYKDADGLHCVAGSEDGQAKLVSTLPKPNGLADPMWRAVANQTGTMVGRDFRGVQVLAAYGPVPRLGLGIVAKADLWDLRAPYVVGGVLGGALVVLCVLLGALPVLRSIAPLVQRLAESEDFGRSVIETAVDAIVCVDASGTVLSVNPAGERMFGYTASELVGSRVTELLAEPDRSELSQHMERFGGSDEVTVLGQGRTITGRRKDGSELPIELAIGKVAVQGRPVLTAFVRDTSERVEAQRELQASQRLLQAVFDTIPFPLTLKDRGSHYLMVNPGWYQFYGHEPHEVLHTHTRDLPRRPPEEADQLAVLDERVVAGSGMLVVGEIGLTLRSGEHRIIRTYKTGLRNEDGDLAGIVSVDVDISELVKQQQALRASQRLLSTVFDTIPHALAIKDRDSRYLMVNRAWREFHGLSEDKVLGVRTVDLQNAPHVRVDDAVERDRQVLDGTVPSLVHEFVRSNAAGQVRNLQQIRAPLRDDDGTITGVLVLSMDMTEHWQAEQAARRAMGQVALLQRVAVLANEAVTPEEALRGCLGEVSSTLGWSLGHVILPDGAGPARLVSTGLWYAEPPDICVEFRALSEQRDFFEDEDLPGLALRRTAPIWVEDLQTDPVFARRLPDCPLRSACVLPVLMGEEAVAVLEFFSQEQEPEPPGMLDVLTQIGTQLSLVVERHRAAQELQASEERFRNLIEGSVQGVVIIRDTKPLFANQAYADILGYTSPEDVLAHWSYEGTFPEGERERLLGYHRARMRGEPAPNYYETQAHRLDGTLIWMETNARTVNWNGERATQITTREVTERKRAESALRTSEERFRNLIEGSQQGIVIYRSGVSQFVNRSFARIFGYDSPEEIMALGSLQDLVDPQETETVLAWQSQVGRDGRPRDSQIKVTGVRRDGQRIQVEAFFQAIEWQGRRAVQVTVADVSDRVRLEDQLRQAQKMEAVGQLAGGVAHDFNNILQIIRGFSELARSKVDGSPAAGYLDKVLKAAENASRVIRQLLALSRREMLRPRNLDMNRLIADLMQMVQRVIGEHIELVLSTRADPAVVQADAALLEQVLLNLCVNARDAMPDGGTLHIATERMVADVEFSRLHGWCEQGPYILITVADTGSGIAVQDREHVFEPFFTTKEAGKGTGLGLSMAYGIVQQHKGLMEVDSDPERGATFRIYLPAVVATPEVPAERDPADMAGGRETVLVAEDEPGVLQLVVHLLESQGYRVLQATHGEEALQVFEAHEGEINLALLDVVMPRQGGRAVYQALQARRPDVPVLFSTGYAADSLDEDFVRTHRFHLIRKPYSPAALFRAVREALDSPWPPGQAAGEPVPEVLS